MTGLATKTAFSAAKSLLEHYGFDLGEQTSAQLIDRWGGQCDPRWIRLALIEALHQGRYKAISVEQILSLWARRGQPSYHFDREFEALICNNQPQDLSSTPPRPQSSEPSQQKTKAADGQVMQPRSQANTHSFVQAGRQTKIEPIDSVQPQTNVLQSQPQQPEVKLPLPPSLSYRSLSPLGSSLLMGSDRDDQEEETDEATDPPIEPAVRQLAPEASLFGAGSEPSMFALYPTDIDIDPSELDAFVAGWEDATISKTPDTAPANPLEAVDLDTLLTELMDTPPVDAADLVNPPVEPSTPELSELSTLAVQEQALQDSETLNLEALEVEAQDQDPESEIGNLQIQIADLEEELEADLGVEVSIEDNPETQPIEANNAADIPHVPSPKTYSPQGGEITKFEPEPEVSEVFNKLREIARIWKLQGQLQLTEPDIIRDLP